MDFLDPKKLHQHNIRLVISYILVAMAIGLATVLLLYQAYGFGVDKGKIIQNGLVFVSSQPGGASLYIDGELKDKTNSRLTLPAGAYTVQLRRDGYRVWQRAITVEGGSVERVDYPLLFPTDLVTKNVGVYNLAPALATQSLDRRWLLVDRADALGNFDEYDLNNPSAATTSISLPVGVLSAAKKTQALKVVEWASDNRHVLLVHTFDNSIEYILFDTQNAANTVNITQTLQLGATSVLSLQNGQYDHYFVHDSQTGALSLMTLKSSLPTPLVKNAIAFKASGNNAVLYATAQDAAPGEAQIMLQMDGKSYLIRNVALSANYLLALAQYNGSWYVAVGVASENRVYIYQDPVTVLQKHPDTVLVPVDALKVDAPSYVAFSSSKQYVVAENANHFAVYDIRYDKDYSYTLAPTFDAGQQNASWIDGAHLSYVSNGYLTVFDYDGTNAQTLQTADVRFLPFFAPNYKFVYSMLARPASGKTAAQSVLTTTALRTQADQ